MEIDETTKTVKWAIDPNEFDSLNLNLTQYVNIIKLAAFDPQKIGKMEVFYNEAESVFSRILVD